MHKEKKKFFLQQHHILLLSCHSYTHKLGHTPERNSE